MLDSGKLLHVMDMTSIVAHYNDFFSMKTGMIKYSILNVISIQV